MLTICGITIGEKIKRKRILRMTIGGGLRIKDIEICIYFRKSHKYDKYEITIENKIVARVDTESNARMYTDALEKGYLYGIGKIKTMGR